MTNENWEHLAVDWPKKQVARLDEELAGTDRAVMALNDRITQLEVRLEHDNGEPLEVWTDRQLEKLASITRDLSRRLDDKLTEADSRLVRLERRHRTLVESSNDWNSQFGERLVEVEARLSALEDWPRSVRLTERITALENGSRLVGPPMPDPAIPEEDRIRNEAYELGRKDAFNEFERRLLEYGHQMRWSANSIGEMIRAFRASA